jgi:DNA-binding response OmpR family regulator
MSAVSSQRVVLMIDSDELAARRAAEVLSGQGHQCHCVADVEPARQAVRSMRLDLILCDVQLPSGSGLELSRQLRAESMRRDIPVMFLSAWQRPDVVHRVYDSRGAYYLRKPYDPDVLVAIVSRALSSPGTTPRRPRPASGVPAPLTHLTQLTRRLQQQFAAPRTT